jgi:hypothetical protein
MTIQAEQELAWYHNEAQARLSVSGIDYEAMVNAPRKAAGSGDVSDAKLAAARRAAKVELALARCSRRQQKMLRLALTERCWQGQDWFDYFRPYGRLAAIVLEYKPAVSPRSWAELELRKALRRFVEASNGG